MYDIYLPIHGLSITISLFFLIVDANIHNFPVKLVNRDLVQHFTKTKLLNVIGKINKVFYIQILIYKSYM